MGLFQKVVQLSASVPTPFLLPIGLSICLVSDLWNRLKIYRAFWQRKRFRQSRLSVLVLIALVVVTPLGLSNGIFWSLETDFGLSRLNYFNVSFLGIQLSTLAIALWLSLLLLSRFTLFWRWQEWIVMESDCLIASIHLSRRATCSVLYHLHIEPLSPQHSIASLFQPPNSVTALLCLFFNRGSVLSKSWVHISQSR
jgi:hypothetical protein